MNEPTIVTCFPLSDTEKSRIQEIAGDDFRVLFSSQEEIGKRIFEADVFCGHAKTPVDWPAVVGAGRLKWIQSSAAGLDHCLVPEVIDSDISVSGCSGLFAPQVAEQTLALLLGLIRSLPVFFRAQEHKQFVRQPTDELRGKAVGIVGLGGNGQRLARVLRPLVSKILATDLFFEHCRRFQDNGLVDQIFPAEQLETLLPMVDVVIVTLPLSEANENRMGEPQFGLMKEGAYFINVGRGSVVETDALIGSVINGRLAGVGIDVVEPEPLPKDSPLWTFENVIISPHVGAQSKFRVPSTIELFGKNVKRFLAQQSLLNLVDKQLGFPRPENRIDFVEFPDNLPT